MLDALGILSHIKRDRSNKVIVRYAKPGFSLPVPPIELKRECWNISITNEPQLFIQNLNERYKHRVPSGYQFKIESIESGIEIYMDLSKLQGNGEPANPEVCDVDLQKDIYLIVHIHHHFN